MVECCECNSAAVRQGVSGVDIRADGAKRCVGNGNTYRKYFLERLGFNTN